MSVSETDIKTSSSPGRQVVHKMDSLSSTLFFPGNTASLSAYQSATRGDYCSHSLYFTAAAAVLTYQ